MKRAIQLGLYVIFLVFLAESGLRIGAHFRYHTPILDVRRFLPDTLLVWKLNPGYHGPVAQLGHGTVNRQGFLGQDLEQPKGADLIRIVVLGGSVTFGVGSSSMENNSCQQLQRLLRENCSPCRYEVINASVPGYSSWQGRNFVEHRLAQLDPDILIFAYGWNDCRDDFLEDKDPSDPQWKQRTLERAPTLLYGGTAIGYILQPFIHRLGSKLGTRRDPGRLDRPRISRVSLPDFRTNLEAVVEWCESLSVHLILMTEPEGHPTSQSWAELLSRHGLYLETIRGVARQREVPLADVAATIDTMNTSLLFRDQEWDALHLNDRGQSVMAQVIYSGLQQSGCLNP